MKSLLPVWRWLCGLPRDVFHLFLIYLPGQSGIVLRRAYYCKRLRRCGRNLTILPGVHLSGLGWIEVGDDVMIRENCVIQTGGPIAKLEERRSIVSVGKRDHIELGLIQIGSQSRVAFGALILGYGGVRVGEKCGIGPGAVILSESFHYKGAVSDRIYKYSQGADLEEQCVLQGAVELMDGAGVASDVVVLPGATIGRDAWVAPASVVRVGARVPEMTISKGDPAAVIFDRRTVIGPENGYDR